MFSSRTAWNRSPNRLEMALRARHANGLPVVDLTMSNPTLCGFDYPDETIRAALANAAMSRYEPSSFGALCAREAVSDYYDKTGISVPPEYIVLTAGTSDAYSYLFQMLADPGDEIITAAPGYPLLNFLADLNDLQLVRYPLLYEDGWYLDLDAIERKLTPQSRALVVVSPNNPAGNFLRDDELNGVVDICCRHGLALIVDEVFSDFGWGTDLSRAQSAANVTDCLTFTLSGLSKTAALPQMKLGWIVANGPPPLLSESLSRLEVIADTYLSVGTLVQYAASVLIEQGQVVRQAILQRVQENNRLLDSFLVENSPCHRLKAEGGWYSVLRVPAVLDDEQRALGLLENHGVLVHPGGFYDFPSGAYLVISMITPTEILTAGFESLRADPLFHASLPNSTDSRAEGRADGLLA